MNQSLFDRSTGSLGPNAFARIQTSQLIHSVQLGPRLQFDGGETEVPANPHSNDRGLAGAQFGVSREEDIWAHQAGVNALSLDVDNRFLISGGADSSIKIWDLHDVPTRPIFTLRPRGILSRTASTHKFGITQLSFYPFDSAAFLSSSYDHHLKLYASDTLQVSADFDLNSIVYSHALSPIASHLLVACATQHPAVRLIDLRSGSNTHSLAGHHGALLCASWSPAREHILASGDIHGIIRLWDIRKSSASLGLLNLEDSIGITGTDNMGRSARGRDSGRAHTAASNAITWTADGRFLISAGHDQKVRVWNSATAANTLASFGPTLRNSHLSNMSLLVIPSTNTSAGKDILFYPNEKEVLMFDLHEGRLLKRLRVPGPNVAAVRSRTGEKNVRNRITGIVWRGQAGGLYSSHTDGQIRAWLPRTSEDDRLDREEEKESGRQDDDDNESTKRKRKVLDDVFRDLTRQKITFG